MIHFIELWKGLKMVDEYHPIVTCALSEGVRWRIFEEECCQKYFGLSINSSPESVQTHSVLLNGTKYLYWKLHTECTEESLLNHCINVAKDTSAEGVKQINDPRGWMACHAKEVAFEIWNKNGIPCPKWFIFEDWEDFKRKVDIIGYPILMRINNGTSGQFTYLVSDKSQARQAWTKLLGDMRYCYDGTNSRGVNRRLLATQFISTTRPENVNMSFRIIVAGNKVVTGYARLGPASDWCAITNRFETWMEKPFIKYQKLCQEFCEKNEATLVKAVKCLGLSLQGVDVILDQNNNPYYLEVQPGFSVGYAGLKSWLPPFYNPSKPDSLVKFLIREKETLQKEIPLYYNYWLDKYAMFDKAWSALKGDIG